IPVKDLGDYKLYVLPSPTTVAARQIKQGQFLDQKNVPFERAYGYNFYPSEPSLNDEPAFVILKLKNTEAAGLGKPLPLGAISVVEKAADGSPILVGQSYVKDTPVGLPMEVLPGNARDILVVPRITNRQTIGTGKNKISRVSFEIVVEND